MAVRAKRKTRVSSKPSGGAKPRPLRDLSAAYRARLKSHAKRHGITVAQLRKRGSGAARGHAAPPGKTEAQIKRERAAAKVEAFAERQAAKWPGQSQADEIAAVLREQIKVHGMSYLQRLERRIAELHRRYMSQTERDKRGRRPSLGINMDDLSEEFDSLPAETFGYH